VGVVCRFVTQLGCWVGARFIAGLVTTRDLAQEGSHLPGLRDTPASVMACSQLNRLMLDAARAERFGASQLCASSSAKGGW
jgi:hypothetical protein